jgi:ATP-binding cassette subfamily B (MDR/TAP) protein 1
MPIPEEDEKQEPELHPSFESRSHASVALTTTTGFGHWMFEVVADLTAPKPAVVRNEDAPAAAAPLPHIETGAAPGLEFPQQRRPSSVYEPPVPPSPAMTVSTRRFSLQFTPTSSVFSFNSTAPLVDNEKEIDEKELERRGTRASSRRRRPSAATVRTRWDDAKLKPMTDIKVELPSDPEQGPPSLQQLSVWALVRALYPTVPYKPLVVFGVLVCLISGAMTPIFSFLLSKLFYEVATGAHDTSTINKYGFIVLSTAALDGIFIGLKFFVMESTSMSWITRVRKVCFQRVLAQDKKWFDKQENAPVRLVQVLIKDGDDARNMIAVVLGQLAVVTSMLGVGLIWALVKGWQLTLVGFAIAPVFAVTMAVQAGLVAKCELRNKRAREEVAKGYYEVCGSFRFILIEQVN